MADRLIAPHGNGLRSAALVPSCHRITIPERDVNHHGCIGTRPSQRILQFFFSSSFLFRFVSRRSTYSATTLSNYNTYALTTQKLGDRLLVFGDVSGYREFVNKFDQIYNKQLRISEKHTFASIIVYERFTWWTNCSKNLETLVFMRIISVNCSNCS